MKAKYGLLILFLAAQSAWALGPSGAMSVENPGSYIETTGSNLTRAQLRNLWGIYTSPSDDGQPQTTVSFREQRGNGLLAAVIESQTMYRFAVLKHNSRGELLDAELYTCYGNADARRDAVKSVEPALDAKVVSSFDCFQSEDTKWSYRLLEDAGGNKIESYISILKDKDGDLIFTQHGQFVRQIGGKFKHYED